MKKRVTGNFAFVFFSFFALLILPDKILCQDAAKSGNTDTLPGDLKKVFQHSCTPCHWAGGRLKSTLHVNFSKWTSYKPEKQASKAKKICSILLNDDMPPASARKLKPETVPSKEQVDAICKWSATLNPGSDK